MSQIPTNLNNIPGYIGYAERVPNSGAIDPTSPALQGNLGEYPISYFVPSVDLSTGVQVNGGQPNWTFGINDVITAGPNPQLQIQLSENYLNGAAVQSPVPDPSFGFGTARDLLTFVVSKYGPGSPSNFNFSVTNTIASAGLFPIPQDYITFGDVGMSIQELSDWYNAHPYSATEWASPAFWQASPQNEKVYVFNTLIQLALNNRNILIPPGSTPTQAFFDSVGFGLGGNAPAYGGQPPPSSVNDFIKNLLNLHVYTHPGQNFNTIPAVSQTALTPSFAAGTALPENAVQIKFGNFLSNYQNIAEGLGYTTAQLEKPETFATAWFLYLSQGSDPPSTVPANIPIYYVDNPNSPNYDINSGNSVPTPGYGTSVSITPSLKNAPNLSALQQDFVTTFVNGLQNDFNQSFGLDPSSPSYNNFSGINLPPGATPTQMFDSNFQTFMDYVLRQGGSTTMPNYDTFMTQWESFVGPTAILNATGQATNSQSLLTYSEIYDVFYPPGTPQHDQFVTNLNDFINGFLGQNGGGTFNPSMMIDQWFKNLVKGVYGTQFVSTPVSLDDANFESVRILNALYRHLASMVQSIQQLTVAQAHRLDFYARMQSVYTATMLKVPVVIQNPVYADNSTQNSLSGQSPLNVISSSPIDSSSPEDVKRRTDFNQLSSAYIESLRSFRSEASDLGNQFQAAFTNSNNAVNQEISVATSILQSVNSIASVIFSQQQAAQRSHH